MRNTRVQSVSLVWEILHDSSKARRAGYHNTDFCKHFFKRDLEENSCRPQYSLYPRGQFPRHNYYMTMQFKYVSSIVLLPLIRLIIEFEWGSLYINLRKSGMVSSKKGTRWGSLHINLSRSGRVSSETSWRAYETTNLKIISVLNMAERPATATVLLFWYVNTGAGCKCILNNSIWYLMLCNESSTQPFVILSYGHPKGQWWADTLWQARCSACVNLQGVTEGGRAAPSPPLQPTMVVGTIRPRPWRTERRRR